MLLLGRLADRVRDRAVDLELLAVHDAHLVDLADGEELRLGVLNHPIGVRVAGRFDREHLDFVIAFHVQCRREPQRSGSGASRRR